MSDRRGASEITDRDIVRRRLERFGVRPQGSDLADIAAGFPTLMRWYEILGEMLEREAEPAVRFSPRGRSERG